MVIPTLQNFIPPVPFNQSQVISLEQCLQATSLLVSYALQKCRQTISIALPIAKSLLDVKEVKDITQNLFVNAAVEKIRSSVSNISVTHPCLLFGLSWLSRKIPIARRVSFVFDIAMLGSVVYTHYRIDQNNIKNAEENKKFHSSNQRAKQLTGQEREAVVNTLEIVEENSQFHANNQKAKQLHNQDQRVIASITQIVEDLKSHQSLNIERVKELSFLANRMSKLLVEKIVLRQSLKKPNKEICIQSQPEWQKTKINYSSLKEIAEAIR